MSISIEKLRFEYPNSSFVLTGEDIHFPPGKITMILGKSGRGKTTLLNLISFISPFNIMPDNVIDGTYYFGGTSYSFKELAGNVKLLNDIKRKHWGYVFQNTFFLKEASIYDNIRIHRLLKDGKSPSMQEIQFAVADSGIFSEGNTLDINKLPRKFSGGQQQRFSIIRAMHHGPEIIFADEPTGNLDPITSEKVFQSLKIWKDTKNETRSLIIATHDLNLAIEIADIIYLIEPDKLVSAKGAFHKNAQNEWVLNIQTGSEKNGTSRIFTHPQLLQLIKERLRNEQNK